MELRESVTKEDAREAIQLVTDAVKRSATNESGIIDFDLIQTAKGFRARESEVPLVE